MGLRPGAHEPDDHLSDDLLRGTIDLLQHSAPSLLDRFVLGRAAEPRQRGMRGALTKPHDTTGRAALESGAFHRR